MRTLAIFLSIGFVLTLIQCSVDASRKARFIPSDELQAFMKRFPANINDESALESHESSTEEDDEKKMIDASESNDILSEEPNVDDNSESISPTFVDINNRKFPSNSDEN